VAAKTHIKKFCVFWNNPLTFGTNKLFEQSLLREFRNKLFTKGE